MKLITRPQAEALLTLAEALEACEALGVQISQDEYGTRLHALKPCVTLYNGSTGKLDGMAVRLAVNALVPRNGC